MPRPMAWRTFQRTLPSRTVSSRCLSSVQNINRSVGRPLSKRPCTRAVRFLAALPSRTRMARPAAAAGRMPMEVVSTLVNQVLA